MAMTKWGRKETIIWPPHGPIYTYGAVFVAVVLTGLFLIADSPSGPACCSASTHRPTSGRVSREQSERAAETITGCSWWALAALHHDWQRPPT